MAERTCAACDCQLGTDVIQVTIGGTTVEVCCEDCAQKLKEADACTMANERLIHGTEQTSRRAKAR